MQPEFGKKQKKEIYMKVIVMLLMINLLFMFIHERNKHKNVNYYLQRVADLMSHFALPTI